MKIFMVSELMPYEFLGGLARHAITLGNQLIELGHSPDILGNGSLVAPSICGGGFFTGALEVCRK